MRRLLFVCPNLRVGGAERHWGHLVPALAERGFEVSVLTLDGTGPIFDELSSGGIETRCALMRSRLDAVGLVRALAVARWRPDVVVSRSVSGHAVGHAIAALAGAGHVAAEHTRYDLLPLRPAQRRLVRSFAAKVDRVIAASPTQKPELMKLGYRSERIAVVAYGIPRPVSTIGREEARKRLGIRAGEFLACMVATLRPEKRPLDFVAAIEQAARQTSNVRGVVVGGGPELAALIQRVERNAAPVAVIGERGNVADVLVAADAACLSSSSEVVPLSLLEAAALGLPLVATRVGDTGAVVRDGETGYLVPACDPPAMARALVKLAAAPSLRARLGDAARHLYEKRFTPARMVDEYVAELEALPIGRRRGRRRFAPARADERA